jgi:hypothetical protein
VQGITRSQFQHYLIGKAGGSAEMTGDYWKQDERLSG